jgi:predicted transcriptional regulator
MRDPELSPSELEVLKVLWEGGPATVREVMNDLRESGRELAYTTVLTFLSRLEAKGCVASDRSGVAYVYRSVVSRDHVTRSRLRGLVDQLFDGAAGPLVLQLVRQERLSASEVNELQRLVDRLGGNGTGT